MNDPSPYWEDGSYIESNGNVGDIVLYYENGTLLHSFVVERRLDSRVDDPEEELKIYKLLLNGGY